MTTDTDHFLERTAAAITSLQSVLQQQQRQRQKHNQMYCNSPQSNSQPASPSSPMSPVAVHNMNMSTSFMTSMSSPGRRPNKLNCSQRSDHRRNLSLDAGTPYYNFQKRREYESHSDKMLNRYNSAKMSLNQKANELLLIKQRQNNAVTTSPIRRSSSFSAQTRTNASGNRHVPKATMPSPTNEQKVFCDIGHSNVQQGRGQLQKSQSSTSFRRFMNQQCAANEFYVNENDDLDNSFYQNQIHQNPSKHLGGHSLSSSSSEDFNYTNQADCKFESDDSECPTSPSYQSKANEHLSNTRINKAFLIRVEQNKAKASGVAAPPSIRGCPNTPEMPRRQTNRQQVTRERQSMPRDSSLQRMKQDLTSFNQTKKTLNTGSPSPAVGKKVQPKYLDISKYKPVQSNNFLKRDETKITKLAREGSAPPSTAGATTQNFLKKSPSCTGIMNRSDPARTSVRSVKSASSGGAKNSAALAAANAQKAKEQELAMWKRRASYDPMKAAAEGKRKEMAKKQQLLQ